MSSKVSKPDWDTLFETAAAQEGYFTTAQAQAAGYSSQLLNKYVRTARISRWRRGIYRVTHFPGGEHEDLVTAWLWSAQEGVLSHQTALALHQLSDVLPSHIHLTLPLAWKSRRLRVPEGLIVHHGDVLRNERTWFGPVPTTKPERTLNDCACAALSPELLQRAARQALRRGIVTRDGLDDVQLALKGFGGIGR